MDEKLVSFLRKEYGYNVEEAYLLGQSELISNKQKNEQLHHNYAEHWQLLLFSCMFGDIWHW